MPLKILDRVFRRDSPHGTLSSKIENSIIANLGESSVRAITLAPAISIPRDDPRSMLTAKQASPSTRAGSSVVSCKADLAKRVVMAV
jgi:hypothetical protein